MIARMVVWQGKPGFPETDLDPGMKRVKVGDYLVDCPEDADPTEEDVAAHLAPPVPSSVTQWQAREALRQAGLLGQVNAFVDSLGADSEAYVAWHYADRIVRASPLIEALAPELNLSDAQLDALFTTAAGLSL